MKRRRLLLVLACAVTLMAHPMGNFSVSHYARIAPSPEGVTIRYVLDLAEIPTFELLQKWNLEATSPRAALDRAASGQAREWTRNLAITSDGRAVVPRLTATELVIAEGAGGMKVMRVAMNLQLPVTAGKIEYEDRNYPERAGWKEIVIAPQGKAAVSHATQGDRERSQALTAYPQDPTVAPPQDLRASLDWTLARQAPVARAEPTPAVPAPETAVSPVPPQPWDPLESTCRHASLSIL